MKPLTRKLRNLGTNKRHTLPTVAMTVAEEAKVGTINVDDANELYAEYYKASRGITTFDADDASIRVNASKLRQIIKAADPALLQRVTDIHAKMERREPVKPLYRAMVDVCRAKIHKGRYVSDTTIRKLLKRDE